MSSRRHTAESTTNTNPEPVIPPFYLSRTPVTMAEFFAASLAQPEMFGAVIEMEAGAFPSYLTCALARAVFPTATEGQA